MPASIAYAYGSTSAPDKSLSYTTQALNQSGYNTGNYQPTYSSSLGNYSPGATVNMGKEVIKGESRIEYVPFEKKIVEYKEQTVVERVPKKTKKVEYR